MLGGTFQINAFKKEVFFDITNYKRIATSLIYFNCKLELLDIIYIPSGKLVANCSPSPFLNSIKHPYDFENNNNNNRYCARKTIKEKDNILL